MQLPNDITPEGHAALIACLRIAAARGRAIREERERQAREDQNAAPQIEAPPSAQDVVTIES